MVVVARGIIQTRYHNFLLERGENYSSEVSRWRDAIFGPRTRITDIAIEVLRLTNNKREGGKQ